MAAAAVATALLLALALPAGVIARTGQPMLFDAASLLTSPSEREATFTELQGLGVHGVRIAVSWNSVAPAHDSRERPSGDLGDPARYDWSSLGPAIEGAHARGWKVVLTVGSPVPRWATEGSRDHLTRPRPSDFKTFMKAIARRFGTQVDEWAIWNEPNIFRFLLPQRIGHKLVSPTIYRNLFVAARSGLTAGGLPRARMLLGETAPRGTPTDRIAPLLFLRGVLCLDSHYKKQGHCKKLAADGYSHHPYTTPVGPYFVPPNRDDVTLGTIARLKAALDKAARAGVVKRRLPIWVTEFGYQSYPDRGAGVSLPQQAEFLSLSERLAFNDSRVASFAQYLLRDDAPDPHAPRSRRYPGFESGLKTYRGVHKPSYAAFRLPLSVTSRPHSRTVSIWGLVRPARASTTVRLQRADGHKAFRTIATVKTRSTGAWTARSTYRKGATWRVQWTAAGGATYTGPPTRAYADTR